MDIKTKLQSRLKMEIPSSLSAHPSYQYPNIFLASDIMKMKPFVSLLSLSLAWAQHRMMCYPESQQQVLITGSNETVDILSEKNAEAMFDQVVPAASANVKVIPVLTDNQICPGNTEASAEIAGNCEYGNHKGPVPKGYSGKCCYHSAQDVFLYAVAGGGKANTKYILDGRPCCRSGTEPTALMDHNNVKTCEYGSHTLKVLSPDELTKCCWDTQGGNFVLHMKENKPIFRHNINKSVFKRVEDDPFYHQDVGIDIHSADVYGYYLAVSARIWASGYLDWSEEDVFNIYLSRDWTKAKNWFPGSSATGHVSIDALTKINDDHSIDAKLHITGTGLFLGALEETIGPYHLDDDGLKKALSVLPLC
ncbi:hypothetical protein F5Y14DRAFT_406218 [Nemania sp. NC0429]|nr:hypothetical protein F5Y14DRAFT_406218 [Nemania sp. NC0429]